jgi:tetratricopeptide (TPR) repeat protein
MLISSRHRPILHLVALAPIVYLGAVQAATGAPCDEAQAALAQRDWPKAVRLADGLVAASPTSPDGFRIRGVAENHLGNYPAALADFDRALKISPGDLESVLGRGRTHRLSKQYDAAVSDFTTANEMAPGQARPLCERGAILILQGKYDASLADYVAAEKLNPDYPGLYSYFAEVYLYMRRAADALAATRKGLQKEPTLLIHQVNLAHSLLFLGHFDEAEADYVRLQDVIDAGKQIPGLAIVRNDFAQMRAAGISIPDMARIEAKLGIE